MLLIDQPLRGRGQAQTHDIGHRLLNMVQHGLAYLLLKKGGVKRAAELR
jgi:hypothetical protein